MMIGWEQKVDDVLNVFCFFFSFNFFYFGCGILFKSLKRSIYSG